MFYVNKESLLKVITLLRREKCVYDLFGSSNNVNLKEPSFCDCKYGYKSHSSFISEQSGCPELRCVEQLLKNITKKEYKKIMER